MRSTKLTYHKERSFASNHFPFSKILFQFRNLIYRVDLMYQPPKWPYSYFFKALEFYCRVFFPCQYPLNRFECSRNKECSRLCIYQKLIWMKVHICSVKAKVQAGNITVKYIMTTQKAKAERKSARDIYPLCWKFSRGPRVQERALLGLHTYLWEFLFNLLVCLIYFCLIFV